MLSKVSVYIKDEGRPTNIPSYESIIEQSFEQRPLQTNDININGVRIALDKKSDLDVSDIWVKFGGSITMAEARTQSFVARYLEENGVAAVRAPRVYLAFMWCNRGFIVSEYIDGPMCDIADVPLVAPAVQALINIPSPSSRPGPIGGGVIEHPFFIYRKSDIWYDTVEELERHVNGILAKTERPGRVDFTSGDGAKCGLMLCVSDLKAVNFMKDEEGRVVAVDFAGYSFLPPCFFTLALGDGDFAHRISSRIEYPAPFENAEALESASYALVPYGTNDIGLPRELRSRRVRHTQLTK